jgi:hypothetical protein
MVRNILLVLIAVINWFIMAIVMSLFTNDTMTVILTSTLIMGGLVLLSLTPAAEKIFRITNGMHPMNPIASSGRKALPSQRYRVPPQQARGEKPSPRNGTGYHPTFVECGR